MQLAQLCDAAGIEFLLPIARWKGYGGETDFEGETWETITWAAGLLAATRNLTVFGTVHVALVHPIFAVRRTRPVGILSRAIATDPRPSAAAERYPRSTFDPGTMSSEPSGQRSHALWPP